MKKIKSYLIISKQLNYKKNVGLNNIIEITRITMIVIYDNQESL